MTTLLVTHGLAFVAGIFSTRAAVEWVAYRRRLRRMRAAVDELTKRRAPAAKWA